MRAVKRLSWVVWVMLVACIDPYDYPFEEKTNYLVVEGAISTEKGPHTVKLTTNINGINNAYTLRVENAKVTIVDTEGNVELLRETDRAVYQTSASFQGVVGRGYWLSIETEDGSKYLSDEEVIMPNTPMTDILKEYTEQVYANDDKFTLTRDGFNMSVILNDPVEQRNNYLFRMNITYQVFTHPERFETFDWQCGVAGCWLLTPKDCCAYCFINDPLPEWVAENDKNFNGRSQAQVPLTFFPISSRHYFDKVNFEVVQYSLTDNAFAFWDGYDKLTRSQGGVFDSPPEVLNSNIQNMEDSSERVLGFFYATSISKQSISFNHLDVPRPLVYTLEWDNDCRLLANSTTERPDFW
jgi:hypothetical protein